MTDATATAPAVEQAQPTQPQFITSLLSSPLMQDQVTVGQQYHGFEMSIATVKRFMHKKDKHKRFGFVTVFCPEYSGSPDGMLDVFVHSSGGYQWFDSGRDQPDIRHTDYLPPTGKIVFLDDIRPVTSRDGKTVQYRADKWILATMASFARVKESIAARPVFRFVEQNKNGDGSDMKVLWKGKDLYDLSQQFPLNGKLISYPLEDGETIRYFQKLTDGENGVWEVVADTEDVTRVGEIRYK